jgi:hypothetical protein
MGDGWQMCGMPLSPGRVDRFRSSSRLNLVERWFAELTNRKLRGSAHRSVTELETGIRMWINEWNKTPKPSVWTKTADQILASELSSGPGRVHATARVRRFPNEPPPAGRRA